MLSAPTPGFSSTFMCFTFTHITYISKFLGNFLLTELLGPSMNHTVEQEQRWWRESTYNFKVKLSLECAFLYELSEVISD